jgi:hypothetical protein
MQIEYFPYCSKKTDYVCKINDLIFGVSVSRAMKFNGDFSIEDAKQLLYKKLIGIQQSTKNIILKNKLSRQILHIWTPNKQISKLIVDEFKSMSQIVLTNTILLITETLNNGEFIFKSNIISPNKIIDKY